MLTKQLKQRLVIGSLGIVALGLSIYFSYNALFKPLFILIALAIITQALSEYYHLARNKGFQPSEPTGIGVSAAYLLALTTTFYYPAWESLPSIILLFSAVVIFLAFFKQQASALGNVAFTLFGVIYLTLPVGFALQINYFFQDTSLEDGRIWLTYVLLVTKITDIGAYFCGKGFGKAKLAPSISPKKTMEGAIGGLAAAVIASGLFALFISHFTRFELSFFQSIWLALILSVLAQLGDLSESLLKRDAGVKDSSHLPGFGGMLDILDSLIFTLPLMYLFLKMKLIG